MELANVVCEHIKDLLMELKVLNRELRRNSIEEQPSTSTGGSRWVLLDRYAFCIIQYTNIISSFFFFVFIHRYNNLL